MIPTTTRLIIIDSLISSTHARFHAMLLAASDAIRARASSPVKDDELVEVDVIIGIGLAAVTQAL